MGAKTQEENLLERLAKAAGCAYLSDLHAPEWAEEISAALDTTPVCEEERAQWNEAARYISGKTLSFETAQEAWKFLKDYAQKRKGQ